MLPLIGVCLGLLRHNWWAARVSWGEAMFSVLMMLPGELLGTPPALLSATLSATFPGWLLPSWASWATSARRSCSSSSPRLSISSSAARSFSGWSPARAIGCLGGSPFRRAFRLLLHGALRAAGRMLTHRRAAQIRPVHGPPLPQHGDLPTSAVVTHRPHSPPLCAARPCAAHVRAAGKQKSAHRDVHEPDHPQHDPVSVWADAGRELDKSHHAPAGGRERARFHDAVRWGGAVL